MATARSLYMAFGLMVIIILIKYNILRISKFCMGANHKHTIKLSAKYFVYVKNLKLDDCVNL